MSPTIFTQGALRFYITSADLRENRRHVHVRRGSALAKFWLEPTVELFRNKGFPDHEVNSIRQIVVQQRKPFMEAWDDYFGR
jgi:hypothetical protein